MPSQYQKRKAKEKPVTDVATVEAVIPANELTHMAYDVFLDSDNSHKIVTLRYNPITRDVVIEEITPISRHVGLVHANQKLALTTLKKY